MCKNAMQLLNEKIAVSVLEYYRSDLIFLDIKQIHFINPLLFF